MNNFLTIVILLGIFPLIAFSQQNVEATDTLHSKKLNEVEVTADKPQVASVDGVLTFDLPTIVKNKPVTNILESLGYLPGVINNNGMIGLAGASTVTIIINGELTNMPIKNLYQLLYSLPIDKMKNVEVMYTAPAKYHVNGAVININLKTPNALDGLQGQIRVGYDQAHYASWGGGLFLSYANKKWSFDLNYSLSRTKTWFREQITSNHHLNDGIHLIEDDNRRFSNNYTNVIYGAIDYKFNAKNHIKLTYNGQVTSDIKSRSVSINTLGNYVNNYSYPSPIGFHNISLLYNSGFGMKIGADYTSYKEDRAQNLFSENANTDKVKATNYQNINTLHLYIDQTHDIRKWQLNYGVGYRYANDYSRQKYIIPAYDSFDGTQIENTVDAYMGLQHNFLCGLSFNASVKGEYYKISDEHNWNFIPQIGMTYYKTPKHIFQLNFTSQRIYPSYWELHGGTSYINDYSMVVGNASLQPYMNYATQLSYIFKQKYVATLYYTYADKYSVQLPYQSPDELKLIFQTLNMNYNQTLGLNIHIPLALKSILESTLSISGFYNHVKSDHFHALSFDREKIVFYGALKNTIKFSAKCPLSLSLDASYISPSLQGIGTLSELWRIDAGVKWTFAHKNVDIIFRGDDIFNSWSPIFRIDYKNQDYRMKVYDRTRNFKVTLVWRFNGFKPKDNPQVDISRYGTGGTH